MCKKTTFLLLALAVLSFGLSALKINTDWVQDYDYHNPDNAVSPITVGMGGINLTNGNDYFAAYDNPALLMGNTGTSAATSFILKKNENLNLLDFNNPYTLLKDKQFMYFSVITKSSAWTYQPVATVHVSEFTSPTQSKYFDYQLDKLQLSVAATDENYSALAGGLSLKYLTGRLVRQTLHKVGSNWVVDPDNNILLVDDKVKGISGDLGFTWQESNVVWGACLYDILSRLWWENYDSASLARRAAMGFQYNLDNLALLASLEGKIAKTSDTTYHLGLVRNFTWKTESTETQKTTEQNFIVRAGLFSKNFNGTKNIHYTLGSGYNYNMFRIDFSLTNSGMQLKNSQYLFSIGAGIKQ